MEAGPVLVRTDMLSFTWHAGLSVSQKQKSIASLHEAARTSLGCSSLLEVSSKSVDPVGIALSAFNLSMYHPAIDSTVSVECAFQAGKVFRDGGPYLDLLHMSSRDAKRDPRIRGDSPLVAFRYCQMDWPLEPQTAFYDWLYINALREKPALSQQVMGYSAFTDIEFNPQQSINCQAYSVALFAALTKRGMIADVASQDAFLNCLRGSRISNARQDEARQGSLF
ncbi:hypothetical protein GCM10019071_14570 [Sphingobium fuliginis]|uniref:Uncharacterized protein n=2 Tax=Sphingobium fuliginis (strain ATCC 27551) TaxID=336203 RepID=A0ABQ1EU73_SPHSA|nr:hypothetical protein GCM10019071_14570 [Sphingobium fuliginis]